MTSRERILVALDTDSADQALRWVAQLKGRVGGFKVGLELVHAAGLDIVARVRDAGGERVFYDAKLHDIPNTVAGAVRCAARLGAWMLNVHASGGSAMMRAACEAAAAAPQPPLMIAVTVLTSLSAQALTQELGVGRSPSEQVTALALLAAEAGMNGVVCSPLEIQGLRTCLPEPFLLVTPGVRPAGTDLQDQQRVATPENALRWGASYLVIGRPITGSPDPLAAVEAIVHSMDGANREY